MVDLLKELGLEINESKTAILHYEGEKIDEIKKVAEAIGLQANTNGKFDGITTCRPKNFIIFLCRYVYVEIFKEFKIALYITVTIIYY